MFVILTCPSKYHPTKLRQRGKNNIAVINHKWKNEAFTPKDGQRYLVKVWSRIRAAFADNEVNVYGVRVVEPHHDATPHWHLLLFTDKASRTKAIEIMRQKALADDPDEKGAQQHRFTCKHMNKGGAVGYIAKYIAKNIDGYALNGDIDFETGKPLTEMAAAVTTWASTWRIPQFHFYNLPSKGVYRECRRLRSVSVADKVGEIAEQVRKAADEGDFAAYIQAQGGPCTPPNQQTLRVAYQTHDQLNAYDEEVQKVVGIYAQLNPTADIIKTRCRKYRLIHEFRNLQKRSINLKPRKNQGVHILSGYPCIKDIYKTFLQVSSLRYSGLALSEVSPSPLSHDTVSRWLKSRCFRPKDLWRLVEPSIDKKSPCVLIADDTLIAKTRSKKIEMVHYQYSGNEHDVIAGIGLVNLLWHDLTKVKPVAK